MKHDVIVIGASLGGLEALKTLFAGFPPDLNAAVLVVWHMPPEAPGLLPVILQRATEFPVAEAANGETLRRGRAYVARPDHHLLVEAGGANGPDVVRLSHGPKENRFRPSVDALFRSAALAFGPRVIGVVLTGLLDDGAAGLYAITKCGGKAVVLDPLDAEAPSMPINAMRAAPIDHCVPIAEIAQVLADLVSQENAEGNSSMPEESAKKRWQTEVAIANEDKGLELGILDVGTPSFYTCPECHGVLAQIVEGNRTRFRCHTGHAFSFDVLLTEVTKSTEDALWNALRAIEETELMLQHMATHLQEAGESDSAETALKQLASAKRRADLVRQAAFQTEILSQGKIGATVPANTNLSPNA